MRKMWQNKNDVKKITKIVLSHGKEFYNDLHQRSTDDVPGCKRRKT